MKVAISRFAIVAAIAGLTALVGVSPVLAQVPNFSSGFSQSQVCSPGGQSPCVITVNGGIFGGGDPSWTPNVLENNALELTANAINEEGSAWFNTPQAVTKPWTSTFQFQLTGGGSGDGFAFVIQNNGLSSIGGYGGGIGYGTRCTTASETTSHCVNDGNDVGIPSSLAIEFDTFQNGYDPSYDAPNQHVAVQSCGASPNSPNHQECNFGVSPIPAAINDGLPHTVKIEYSLPNCSESECGNNLSVSIDGTVVLTTSVDLNSVLSLNNGNAFVGFTAATKGASEAHDILNWTFAGSQTQTVTGDLTTFDFGPFNFTAQLNGGGSRQVTVTPIVKNQADCNALVQANFSPAQCFVYDDAAGPGNPAAVMFEVTCPDTAGDECSSFDAELGTGYHFTKTNNPGYRGGSPYTGNPLPGWLKGHPSDTVHPCNPDSGSPLFQSNQIESFSVQGDPVATTKGKSGGTGSCWVATYNTPNELPGVTGTIPSNGANYPQGSSVLSNFACTAVNKGTAIAGPYLTVPPTIQVQDPPAAPALGCSVSIDGGAPIDLTTTPHPPIPTTGTSHTFVATVTDSATDTTSTQTIKYNVVGPADVALVKLAPFSAATNSKITYTIGVGNLGPNNALNVTLKDTLPAGLSTTGVSGSASNVSCSLVNKKIVCTTTSKPCTINTVGNVATVTCNVGTIVPLSLSPLNGAAVQISTKVTAAAGTSRNPVVIKNTATASADNADPHTNNNTSSASTTVTAH